ncbi:MAG: hypothetical protein K8T90_20630 [Planctomycetes bacterium]|nr:hypothetical protein [Planctomycetota bacterium]
MKYETDWKREWETLRAEREVARRKWRRAADGLTEHARDPLGLGKMIHDNPVASTGVGAIVGAMLVKMFIARKSESRSGTQNRGSPPPAQSMWSTIIREAALSVAVPWLMRMMKEKFGWDLDPAAPHAPAPDGARVGEADSATVRS